MTEADYLSNELAALNQEVGGIEPPWFSLREVIRLSLRPRFVDRRKTGCATVPQVPDDGTGGVFRGNKGPLAFSFSLSPHTCGGTATNKSGALNAFLGLGRANGRKVA